MKKINWESIKEKTLKHYEKLNIRLVVIGGIIIFSIIAITVTANDINGKASKESTLQGMVYAKDVSINTKIPGRIVKFYVEEGQKIKAGDPIVEISSEELEAKKLQLLAQVEQAIAGVDAAQAVVDMAQANYNASQERVEQAKAGLAASQSQRDIASAINDKAENGARTQEVAQAESAYTLWQSTYDRALVLYEGGAISKQKMEEVKTQMEVSKLTLDMAKEGARTEDKAAASAQLSMAESGVLASNALVNQSIEGANAALAQLTQAQAGLVAAQGKLEQAQAGLQEVEVYLKDTNIKAPIDGVVTAINSDEGELVSTGTSIGTISNLDTCWIHVNLDEDKLAGIVEGQEVNIKLLAYQDQIFKGKIVSINKQPDFAVKKATNENGNFDIVSFGVKIEIENKDQVIRPGMTAIVDFRI